MHLGAPINVNLALCRERGHLIAEQVAGKPVPRYSECAWEAPEHSASRAKIDCRAALPCHWAPVWGIPSSFPVNPGEFLNAGAFSPLK